MLTGKIREDQVEEEFKLTISKSQSFPGVFLYDVLYKNLEVALKDSVGFLLYDIISFNLPVKIEENVISYNCLGIIDDHSFLNGICSTIAPNELGESKSYSWSFTGIPSSVH